jgi:beta-lactamase regulating signal transducer with metallopeptidase domain
MLALMVALLAAVVSPYVTYHWFAPSTKLLKERGIFIITHSAKAPGKKAMAL